MSLASVKCLKYNMFTFNVRNLKKYQNSMRRDKFKTITSLSQNKNPVIQEKNTTEKLCTKA